MARVEYDPSSSVLDARKRYFASNAFGDDGGYDAKWVSFKLGPLPLSIPNTSSRIRAVAFHDVHHIITGYDTDTLGEFEISAWEIAAGCKDYWAAWFINLGGLTGGLIRAPTRTFRAFVRGRHSHTLYGSNLDDLLQQSVAELRARSDLHQADHVSATALDAVLFAASAVAGLITGVTMFVVGTLATPLLLVTSMLARSSRSKTPSTATPSPPRRRASAP